MWVTRGTKEGVGVNEKGGGEMRGKRERMVSNHCQNVQ